MKPLLSPVAEVAHGLAMTRADRDVLEANAVHNAFVEWDRTCMRAPGWIREGRPGWAEFKLTRAALKVAQAVGEAESVGALEDLVYVAPFEVPHRSESGEVDPGLVAVASLVGLLLTVYAPLLWVMFR